MAKIAPCLILLLLAASPGALADSWRSHGYYSRGFDHRFTDHRDYWRGGHISRSRWDRGRQFGRPNRGNFVSLSYGNWSGHSGYRYNRHYSRGYHRGYRRGFNRNYYRDYRNNDAAVLVGGVVLGSLLTQTFSHQYNSYRAAPVVTRRVIHSSPARVVPRQTVTRVETRIDTREETRNVTRTATPRPSTYLLRDLQGDCFEVERDSQGTELRTQVAAGRCQY